MVLLWLEGPFQSWGVDSKFDRRDTLNFPTKSGLTGLILSAMGDDGTDSESLAEIVNCGIEIIAFEKQFKRSDENFNKFRMRDFHMVGSGYNEHDDFEKLFIPKKSDGGKANKGGRKLTYRYYLHNMVFAVILECSETLAQKISDSFMSPVFDVYLGRKNCVPSMPVFQGIFNSRQDIDAQIEKIKQHSEHKEKDTSAVVNPGDKTVNHLEEVSEEAAATFNKLFTVIEGEKEGELVYVLQDVPVQFGKGKKYGSRKVSVIYEGQTGVLK